MQLLFYFNLNNAEQCTDTKKFHIKSFILKSEWSIWWL